MKRKAIEYLKDWAVTTDRKPLILRGARQVGKTWLVREFAKEMNKQIIEVNFEDRLAPLSLFSSNDPKEILLNLSSHFNTLINPNNSLLFLDEIQAAPEMIAKLRWFYEKLPELTVIAAGSLLEFLMADHAFNMPVGRISYMYLEPLSFEEFLLANNKDVLLNYIFEYNINTDIPLAIHEQLMGLFKEYMIVGGLPAVVKSWICERSLISVQQIQNDLLTSYRDDFSKHKYRVEVARMDEVMAAIPKMLGQKFVYSRVNPDIPSTVFKKVLFILNNARICHRVSNTSANGIPLAAEIKEKFFKEIYLDIGLCSINMGLSLTQIKDVREINLINHGGISEQVVGQILRTNVPFYMDPSLYYWSREEKGSNAEIDFVIQFRNKVIPLEVKSGSTGSLKSLHVFMDLKKYSTAVRINSDVPSTVEVNLSLTTGNKVIYQLISIPFYLLGQLNRILEQEVE